MSQVRNLDAEPGSIAFFLNAVTPAALPLDAYQEKFVFANSLKQQQAPYSGIPAPPDNSPTH